MTHTFKTLLLATTICSLGVTVAHAADYTPAATPAAPAAAAPAAPAPTDFFSALTGGNFWLDARYRYEEVHQASLQKPAIANTLRTIGGYNTGEFKHFKAQVAVLDNLHISDDQYNDGFNGKTTYPSIGDPEDLQLFLANFTYSGLPDTTAIVGRQQISLDNQRWVGAPQWRQISQTFDGVLVKNKSIADLELLYSFLFHQNRSPGSGVTNGTYDMHTHLLHAAYSGVKDVKFIGYGYLADIRNGASAPVAAANSLSSQTYGVRAEASHKILDNVALTGNFEYAHQSNYAANPNSFDLNYYLIEPGVTLWGVKTKVGYEYLGGNGISAVQTPMYSGHAADGWSDVIAVTPANGLEDAYVNVGYSFKLPCEYLGDTKITGEWHDYNAAHISSHLGNEFDFDFVQDIGKNYAVGFQYENFITDHFTIANTQKIIVTGQVKF